MIPVKLLRSTTAEITSRTGFCARSGMVASVDTQTSRCSVPAQCRSTAAAALAWPSSTRRTRLAVDVDAAATPPENALWGATKPSGRRRRERERRKVATAAAGLGLGGLRILWYGTVVGSLCGEPVRVTRTVRSVGLEDPSFYS